MKNKKKLFSLLEVSIITITASIIMCFMGALLIYKHLGGVNYSLLGTDKELQEFISAYSDLTENYYDELDTNALIDGAINGMYSIVNDPYTTYLDSENSEILNETLKGEYEGIGVTISKDENDIVRIEEVFEESPAEKVGLKGGDILIKINGEDVRNKSTTEIATNIKAGEHAELTVIRDTTELTFIVQAKTLYVPSVNKEIIEIDGHKIGYINLTVFNETAEQQMANALTKLEDAGIESLILDLRNNTGGYLQIAYDIAEMFIPKGKLIYSLENKKSKEDFYDETEEKRNYKITILTNGASASASEILAASLKYSYGAKIVGTKTYGKGKVQEKSSLTDGTSVKYTTAKWLMPNGENIDGIGIEPDVIVEFDKTTYEETNLLSDNQIKTALDVILK